MTIDTIRCPHCLEEIACTGFVHDDKYDTVDCRDMVYIMCLKGECPCGRKIVVNIEFEPSWIRTRAYKDRINFSKKAETLLTEVE